MPYVRTRFSFRPVLAVDDRIKTVSGSDCKTGKEKEIAMETMILDSNANGEFVVWTPPEPYVNQNGEQRQSRENPGESHRVVAFPPGTSPPKM
jgi:hypothetical protein